MSSPQALDWRRSERAAARRVGANGVFVVSGVFLVISYLAVAGIPFLSEDWTQMAEMKSVATIMGALDPRLEPLRPFQHAFFWLIAHSGIDPTEPTLPIVARLVGFAFHVSSCICVHQLSRRAGLGQAGAAVALVLFVFFPNVKSLAWSAAIGSPARVAFELAALLAFSHHLRAPSAWKGALGLALFCAALACHESALLFPGLLALWIAFENAGTIRDRAFDWWRAARDPWLLALALSTLVYVVMLALRTQRHHQVKSLAALPANVVKAATALLPEFMRTTIVDGFRGPAGEMAFYFAAAALLGLAAFALVLVWRSRLARFVLMACALELTLPVLGTGFVQRYAYLASALLAIGLGAWIQRTATPSRVVLVIMLAGAWLHDSVVDLGEYRDAGRMSRRLAAEVRILRTSGGREKPIAIVDPPDMVGAEFDVPLFNWGLDFMLAAQPIGSDGNDAPILLWRTIPYRTSTNVELVDAARIDAAARDGSPQVLHVRIPPRR